MIRFLYILAKHGINPFSKIDDIAIGIFALNVIMTDVPLNIIKM